MEKAQKGLSVLPFSEATDETGLSPEDLEESSELSTHQMDLAPYFPLQTIPLDRQPARVYLGSLDLNSQRTMCQALLDIVHIILPEEEAVEEEGKKCRRTREQMKAEREMRERIIYEFPWGQLRFEHTSIIRAKLDARYKYTTANRCLSALRMVLHRAWLMKQMSIDDYMRAREIKNIRGQSVPKGRALQPGEINALINACLDDERVQGCRDLAIILLLFSTGIRRAECSGLDLVDYNPLTRELLIHGKGNKERIVYVESEAGYTALDAWIEQRGSEPGPLFCPIEKGEHFGHVKQGVNDRESANWQVNLLARLSEEGIYYILKQRVRQAGITDLSPHDFRRNMISEMFDHNIDVSIMMRLTGHSNLATLVRYDRRPERAKKVAAGVMQAPVVQWKANQRGGKAKE